MCVETTSKQGEIVPFWVLEPMPSKVAYGADEDRREVPRFLKMRRIATTRALTNKDGDVKSPATGRSAQASRGGLM